MTNKDVVFYTGIVITLIAHAILFELGCKCNSPYLLYIFIGTLVTLKFIPKTNNWLETEFRKKDSDE